MSARRRNGETFVDAVLSGGAGLEDIDDYVDAWHDLPESEPGAHQELHEWLGLSWPEYQLWVEEPPSLRFVISARVTHRPLETVLENDALALAARADEQNEAVQVLNWLRARGRIE
jgi:hypothetical protein